jgi:hypothetical protein
VSRRPVGPGPARGAGRPTPYVHERVTQRSTVAKEMGHGGEAMVRKVYGHLGTVRHRAEVVEYRVAQHKAKLGDRLETLLAAAYGTTNGTTRSDL